MVKCLALEMGTFSNYISINLKISVSVLLTECASQLFNIHKKRRNVSCNITEQCSSCLNKVFIRWTCWTLFLFSYTAFTDVINMVLIHE